MKLGEVILTAYNTPSHTRGATTWVTTLVDDGKAYTIVFPDGAGFNPGYQLAKPEAYPGINKDYRDTLQFLEGLRPDIWLPTTPSILIWRRSERAPAPKARRHGLTQKDIGNGLPVSAAHSRIESTSRCV